VFVYIARKCSDYNDEDLDIQDSISCIQNSPMMMMMMMVMMMMMMMIK